jgi:hypothetical protein
MRQSVIARLDRAIQKLFQRVVRLDAPVKPGHDVRSV